LQQKRVQPYILAPAAHGPEVLKVNPDHFVFFDIVFLKTLFPQGD
jgi:hypothetical protein